MLWRGPIKLTDLEPAIGYGTAMPISRESLYGRHRFPAEVISYGVWL
jgi:hypothetical protein